MSVKVSVIICNDYGTNQQKIKFATDRRIPAVRKTWLWACLRTGGLQPYSDFQLNTFAHQPQTSKPKPKPHSSTEAPLEKSSGLQQRKAQAVVKVPKPRGPAHPRALNLVPSANTTPATTSAPQTRPNISTNNSPDDCDIAIPGYDGHASLPLQDISANSPCRPSTSSNELKPIIRNRSSSAESLIRPPRKAKDANHPPHEQAPGSVIPADTAPAVPEAGPTDEKDYSDILAQLRANRKPVPSPADPNSSTRRRGRRQLGRAASTRSNGSSANGSGRLNLDDTDEQEKAQEYQPSQELGWDTPGAAKAREQMIKRLGGRVEEKSVRVEGIGVVRDVASEATGGSIGGRASRKKRAL
jgi:DNA replication regulator DPB11